MSEGQNQLPIHRLRNQCPNPLLGAGNLQRNCMECMDFTLRIPKLSVSLYYFRWAIAVSNGMQDDSETMMVLDKHLAELLHSREYPKTICPSEVARAFSKSELSHTGTSHWRDLMDPIRSMLFDMRSNGQVEILQRGEVIPHDRSLENIRGPIRARLIPMYQQ